MLLTFTLRVLLVLLIIFVTSFFYFLQSAETRKNSFVLALFKMNNYSNDTLGIKECQGLFLTGLRSDLRKWIYCKLQVSII